MKLNSLKPTWKISEKLILENFKFLQNEFDFPKFKKKWIRDEYYITTEKDGIEFCCLIFQLSSTSPEIEIIDKTKTLKNNSELKKSDYYKIDSLDKTGKLKKIAEKGREYIEFYVEKCAELIKEKPSILKGNTNEFELK
jgi:hypothetical protein